MPWKKEFTIENEHGDLTTYSGDGASWYPEGDNTSPDAHFTMGEDVDSFHVSVPRGGEVGLNTHFYFSILDHDEGPRRIRDVDEANVPRSLRIVTQYLELAQRFWFSAWEPEE